MVTPLRGEGDSKMSGEEPLLEGVVHSRWRINSLNTDRVSFLFKIQCVLQEGNHSIYRDECLGEGERKGRGVNDYTLLETRSNVSTWGSLLESRSEVST